MLSRIIKEVEDVVFESLTSIAKNNQAGYVLLLGRADVIKGLKQHVGTDCVIDYELDRYFDKTREQFYIRYFNKNYRKEGFVYQGDEGIFDLSIEMMIYSHMWESTYFLKTLYRLAQLMLGKGYDWTPSIPGGSKNKFMKRQVIEPLKAKGFRLGDVIDKAFKTVIRNAFAHSLYTVDTKKRTITTRTKEGNHTYTFDEFQEIFLYSTILMHTLHNCIAYKHDRACEVNSALTKALLTPDGLKVQVYGHMVERGNSIIPEFQLVKIKEL